MPFVQFLQWMGELEKNLVTRCKSVEIMPLLLSCSSVIWASWFRFKLNFLDICAFKFLMTMFSLFFYLISLLFLVIWSPYFETEIDQRWSREGQKFSFGHDLTFSRKIEDTGTCWKRGRHALECCREKAHAGLQWKTSSFTSSTRVLLGRFANLYWGMQFYLNKPEWSSNIGFFLVVASDLSN